MCSYEKLKAFEFWQKHESEASVVISHTNVLNLNEP